MKEKLTKVLDKIIWILKLFVSRDFQEKIKLKIPYDKQQHGAVCFTASAVLDSILVLSVILIFTGVPIWLAIIAGVVAVSLFGIAYEIYQKISGTGVFDWGDILADVIGAIAGGVLVSFITFILLEIFS
jgi:VanZ family protein